MDKCWNYLHQNLICSMSTYLCTIMYLLSDYIITLSSLRCTLYICSFLIWVQKVRTNRCPLTFFETGLRSLTPQSSPICITTSSYGGRSHSYNILLSSKSRYRRWIMDKNRKIFGNPLSYRKPQKDFRLKVPTSRPQKLYRCLPLPLLPYNCDQRVSGNRQAQKWAVKSSAKFLRAVYRSSNLH